MFKVARHRGRAGCGSTAYFVMLSVLLTPAVVETRSSIPQLRAIIQRAEGSPGVDHAPSTVPAGGGTNGSEARQTRREGTHEQPEGNAGPAKLPKVPNRKRLDALTQPPGRRPPLCWLITSPGATAPGTVGRRCPRMLVATPRYRRTRPPAGRHPWRRSASRSDTPSPVGYLTVKRRHLTARLP